MRSKTFKDSRFRSALFGLVVFVVSFHLAYKEHAHVLDEFLQWGSDNWGYYQFLPAVILGEHEITHLPWAIALEDGKRLSVFTIGVALMQLPFFLVGHFFAMLTGSSLTGYTAPYAIANLFATTFYVGLGFYLLHQALRRKHTELVVAITLGLTFFCTNLYYYSIHETGMSHGYSFFLMSWLVYLTTSSLEKPTKAKTLGLIVCLGMIVLIRQPNGIAFLFPLLFGVGSWPELKERVSKLLWPKQAMILGALVIIGLWALQSLYWYKVTGNLVVFTYGTNGQGFDWLRPELWNVLFSHDNGWFIITPVMFLVVVWTVLLSFRGDRDQLPILIMIACIWYIYASWWCWYLGGAYGHRGFVEYYAFLSIPFASLITWIFRQKMALQIPATLFLVFLVHMNVSMVDLYHHPWHGPTWSWQKLFDVWEAALKRLT